MAKIPKWLIDKKGLTKEDMDKFICRNGSFTCGLLTKLYPLDIIRRCRLCRKQNLSTSQSEGTELKFKVPSTLEEHEKDCDFCQVTNPKVSDKGSKPSSLN